MDIPVTTVLPWIPALPLMAAVVTAVLGPRVLRRHSHWPTIVALAAACLASLWLVVRVQQEQHDSPEHGGGYERIVALWSWADIPGAYAYAADDAASAGPMEQPVERRAMRIDIVLRADSLTAMMLGMVTFVSTLVAIFSVGYMDGDRGYWRFFCYIALFVFSMTMLVCVSNFLLLFVFWEAVGVCSYLLIGFWYHKPEAVAAGKKAFLVNRVGDFGFTLAIFLIWTTFGTLNFHDTPIASAAPGQAGVDSSTADVTAGVLGKARIASGDYMPGRYGPPTLFAICLLLMIGACGKSAQFPLHVWLPDAMEGPTPVSALIHAATMVTAGVYMVARCTPLFAASPDAQLVVAACGGLTALLAGSIAIAQFDLKRVLAYSTISQLGYMFMGLGAGTLAGVSAGMFHLFTHAFFKALLFLGAGSVMHAMGHVIDIRRFSGLRRIMPITHWTFLAGCLALSGIPPLAGFWSKDAIVASLHDRLHELEGHGEHDAEPAHAQPHSDRLGHEPGAVAGGVLGLSTAQRAVAYTVIYYGALFTAFLTACYTFRAYLRTFFGPLRVPQEAGDHAKESPPSMTAPLVVLAVCSLVVGVALDWTPWSAAGPQAHLLGSYLASTPSLASGAIAGTSGLDRFHWSIALTSSGIALAGTAVAVWWFRNQDTQPARYLLSIAQWKWFPHLSRISLLNLCRDKFYFDQIYDVLIVWPLRQLAGLSYVFDRRIVDGLVDWCGKLPVVVGQLLRSLQMGLVQFYALSMILVVVIVLAAKWLWAVG